MSDVKEVKVTEDYLGLDEDIRKCQKIETFEDCTTREYLKTVLRKCNCVPYGLRTFSKQNQVCNAMINVYC